MKLNKINKKTKEKILTIKTKYNLKLINTFINFYPELSSGRKNYLEKEIEIAKEICLAKMHKKTKNMNLKSINIVGFNKKSNTVSLIAAIIK